LYAYLNVRSPPLHILHPDPIIVTVLADCDNGLGLGVGEIDRPVSFQLQSVMGFLAFHASVCIAFAFNLARKERAAACGDFRPTKILLTIVS
jgi:hypothetical protein